MFRRLLRFAVFLLTGFSMSLQARENPPIMDRDAVAAEHPLGGMRYVFVSPVDGNVWGVVCPGHVSSYVGLSLDEVLRCGYTQSVGPVNIEAFFRAFPPNIDRYTLEQDMRSQVIVPVASSRDRYYEVWEALERVSRSAGRPVSGNEGSTSCFTPTCRHFPMGMSIDVHSQTAAIYIYATDSEGQVGSFDIFADGTSKLIYLNKTVGGQINLECGFTTIYISRELRDQVIINEVGGASRLFYL